MKKKKIDFALLFIVITHVILLFFLFGYVKNDYHSDEVWSYGIANSSVAGAIFKNADGDYINLGEWISGDVFHEYLTVQNDERFDFSIPYTNAKNDYHPPLSFFLIHLISSFFPGVFSFWFFIPFNILAMVLCDLFMYRILKLCDMPRFVCLAGSFWVAFCSGGINMAVYLRMYTLLTAFGLMMFYFSLKVVKEKKLDTKTIIKLVLINVLGGLTCYEYFVFAFLVAFVVCIVLMSRRKIKLCIQYGLSMLCGVMVSLVLFPDAIYDMLENIGGNGFSGWETYPAFLQIRMLISMFLKDIIGITINPYTSYIKSIVPFLLIIGYIVLVLSPVYFIIRKYKNGSFVLKMFEMAKNRLRNVVERCKWCFPLMGISLFVTVGFVLIMNSSISVYRMQNQAVRYFFVIYPLIELIFLSVLCVFFNLLFNSKKCISICCICLCLVILFSNVFNGMPAFLSGLPSYGQSISDIKNGQIIVLLKSESGLERIVSLVDKSNVVLAIPYDDLEDYSEEIAKLDTDKDVYIALQGGAVTRQLMKNSWEQTDVPVDFNSQQQALGEIQNNNLENIENNINQYFKQRFEIKSIDKIGYNATLNDDFTLYKMIK